MASAQHYDAVRDAIIINPYQSFHHSGTRSPPKASYARLSASEGAMDVMPRELFFDSVGV